MYQKILATFVIIVLSMSLFVSQSFSVDIGEFTKGTIEHSSITDVKESKKRGQENDKKFPDVDEMTISEVRKLRAAALATLGLTINKLPDSVFFSEPQSSKSSLGKNIQDAVKLVEEGSDYGAYLLLENFKGNIKQKIKESPPKMKVDQIIDDILISIHKQTAPGLIKIEPPIVIIESPLKQFKKGIPVDNIVCKDDLVLMKKSVINTPGCFKMSSVKKIIDRGWGTEVN